MSDLGAALHLRQLGLSVIPIHAPGMPLPRGAPAGDAGKVPLIPWKEFQERQPTEQEIRSWAARWPNANLAVVTGKISGVIVLDVDGQAGVQTIGSLPPIPETCRSSTGRGQHIWFNHPGGTVANFVKRLPGLDLRGDGGYVVAPPSIHASGLRYAWVHGEETALADPPDWLVDLIRPNANTNGNVQGCTDLERISEGARNDTLYRIGRSLKARGLSPAAVLAALRAENQERCEPPLDDAEVTEIGQKALTEADRPGFQSQNSFPPYKGVVGKETNFWPVKAEAFLAEEPEPIVWVWDQFLPEGGLALVTAFMKVGKSTFIYFLLVAIAQGRPFLEYATKQGGVLILAVEEHPRDVRLRLRRLGACPEDPIYLHTGRLDCNPATMAALRDFITDHEISLVVLDTLGLYWTIKDENNNAAVVQQCSPFLDLARETGCCVVLVHHDRKAGGEEGRGIRGGSALLGLVDQAIMLDKRQGGNKDQRMLRTVGRYAETPPELVLELAEEEYRNLGTPEEVGRDANMMKVWAVLTDEPKDLVKLTQEALLNRRATVQALDDLSQWIIREGEGKKGDPYRYLRKEG